MKRVLAALTAAVLAALLTGCGSSTPSQADLSASALLAKARAYVGGQQYVSLNGRIDQAGTDAAIDLNYVGKDSSGTITLSGASIELESIAGTTYFKPSKSFWTQQLPAGQAAMVANILGEKWIVASPANADFAQLIQVAKRSFLISEVLTPSQTVTKGAATTVAGVKAIPLNLKSGVIYLAESDARPLQVKGSSKTGSGTATFSYTQVAIPAAPAAGDRVDLAKLLTSSK